MKAKKRTLALIAALGLGLASAVVTYSYLRNLSSQTVPTIAKPQTIPVVVAKRDIPSKTAITADMIGYGELPKEALLPGTITNLDDAIGVVTKSQVVSGEPLNQERLWDKGVSPGLSFQIPMGKRAITIGINEVIGVAGFVKPGDYVDILATISTPNNTDTTSTILQHVQVLAIAQQTEDKEGGEPKVTTNLTLAVTLDEAARVTLAEERGVLRVVLRPADQHEQLRTVPVTSEEILNVYNPAPVRQVQEPKSNAVVIRRLPSAPPKPVITKVEVIKGVSKEIVEVH